MTAKEAREKSDIANNSSDQGQFVKIEALIKGAVNKGEYSINFYDTIRDAVRKRLVDLGYVVGRPQSDRDETIIKISW